MKEEFEVISHGNAEYKIFLVNLLYRTPHVHKDFEVCLLLEGAVHLSSRDSSFCYRKGDLWVNNPFESHELLAEEPALILSLQISPGFFSSFFPQIETTEFSLPDCGKSTPEKVRLASFFLKTAEAYFQEAPASPLHCAGLICLFFDRLLKDLPCTRISERERQASRRKAQRIRVISDYIDRHYQEKLFLSDIAGELGLTMSYLSHFFKSCFHMPFQSYLLKLRCEKARQLLWLTDLSLLDISIACGFSDIKYFTKGFQKQFGCSPRQYRLAFTHKEPALQQKSMLSAQEFLSPAASRSILETYSLPDPEMLTPDPSESGETSVL